MWLELFLFLLVAWLAHWIRWRGFFSKLKHPPSFYGFPLVGILPFLGVYKNQVELARDTAKKHGSVFRFRFGPADAIMVNGAQAVKEALKNDDFLGRPPIAVFALLQRLMNAKVFSVMENDPWRHLRSLSVQALKELGFGKTPRMEEKIQDEVSVFLDELATTKGEAYDPNETMLASVSNNIATLIFGDRLPYEHPRRRCLNDFLQVVLPGASFLNAFSFVPIIVDLFQFFKVEPVQTIVERSKAVFKIFNEEAQNHRKNHDENDKRDFMDHLISQEKVRPELFNDQTIRGSCLVFFGAGSNTSRITVEYLMQLMAAHPQLQEQMYQEIKREVGDARLPTWADREKLHLTNAIITERMRIFPIVPFGLFRKALKDTKIQGYDVKKGSVLIYNLASAHYDTTVFENPSEFKPSRFLDASGNFVPNNNVIPFAIGKRACPGETFATFEIFLYFSAIIQRFRVEPLKDKPVELTEATEFFSEPLRQKLHFVKRT